MRKPLIVALSLLGVVLVGLTLAPWLLDGNRYHDQIQAQLANKLGRKVELGRLRLSLLPPSCRVHNVIIADDPRFSVARPFAQAVELDMAVQFWPLLHRQVRIESLRLKQPQVELIRAANGEWNFSSLALQRAKSSLPTDATQIEFDRLQIDGGQVAVTDQLAHQPRVEYHNIDLTVRRDRSTRALQIVGRARLPGAGELKLSGSGGPIQDATLTTTPLQATLELKQVALSGLRQYLQTRSLSSLDGVASGMLHVASEGSAVILRGTVRLDKASLHGQPLGSAVVLDCDAREDRKTAVMTVQNTRLSLGVAALTLHGTVNRRAVPMTAEMKLNAADASLAELAKLVEATGFALSPGRQASGAVTADLLARGPLDGPALAGTIRVDQLNLAGLQASSAQVALNLDPFGEDVVRTLRGAVTVDLRNGQLRGIDLAKELGAIGKFAGMDKIGNGVTHIDALHGTFALANGVAVTNDLQAETDAGKVSATGATALATQALALQVTVVLSPQRSQQVGGAGIGGLMMTALQNKNGQIVMPLKVSGTLSHPRVTPDLAAMAKMRWNGVGHVVPGVSGGGSSGTASGIQKALGRLFGKKP